MADSQEHHDHDYDHSGHGGGGHSHAPKVDQKNLYRVGFAAVLTGSFMVVELIGGYISGSLALIADAGHMLTDFAALSMAWGAFIIARRLANWKHTFGYDRFSILVAFVNGLALFLLCGWIIWEAANRFRNPVEILAGPMLVVAVLGLLVNLLVLWILRGANQENLNIRGAMLHVMGDLLGSAAAIIAALIIMRAGWTPIDPILSVFVAVIILRAAWHLVKDSAHILLEGAPDHLDSRLIKEDLMREIPQIMDVHHIHAWSITQERPMLTLEAIVDPSEKLEPIANAIKARLAEKFQIDHTTVEVRRASSANATSSCAHDSAG